MERVRSPFDKEWNRFDTLNAESIHHSHRLPFEGFSIWSCARTVARAEDLMARLSRDFGNRVDVCGYRRPGDQSRHSQLPDINLKIESSLRRIWRDDFEILFSAQR